MFLSVVLLTSEGSIAPEDAAAAKEDRPPNILLIVSDDQPLGTMGVMDQTRRWLRNNGTKYPNAYATTPVCCPSRASMLTGQYAHNHGVRRNGEANLIDTSAVVQRFLREGGYTTAAFGKFLNSWDVAVDPPSFDRWAVVPRSAHAYWGGRWNIQGDVRRVQAYGTTFVGKVTSKFIEEAEEDDDTPWFAYLAPPAPHAPFDAEKVYEDVNYSDWPGVPSNFEDNPAVDPTTRLDKPDYVQDSHKSQGDGRNMRELQLRTLLSLDDMVGQVREVLAANDESENTMIVFISDNGFLWAQHGIVGKFTPYVESVRVPALIRWPEDMARPPVDERLVANIDLAPTFLDVAGITPGPDFTPDGRSLLDDSWSRDRLLIEAWAERRGVPTWAGFVSTTESYVEYYDTDNSTVSFQEYYDLVDDPYQMTNLFNPFDLQMSSDLAAARTCAGPSECP